MIHLSYDSAFLCCCNISVTTGAYYTAETEKNQGVPVRFGTFDGKFSDKANIRPDLFQKSEKITGNKRKKTCVKRLTFVLKYDILNAEI